LIEELDAAHALLIDTPVHNYTVPAELKTWIDYVVRVGRTFKSTSAGKVGTLRDRPTVVVSASGGYFSGSAPQPDFFTPYLDAVLATIGIRSVRHIRLEGLRRGDDAVRAAYVRADQELSSL
jgi:FMN-dependent NADH-azoreductase